jgi:hypothetical protein
VAYNTESPDGDENHRAFLYYSIEQIKRFQEDPKKVNLTPAQQPPDGQPIRNGLVVARG